MSEPIVPGASAPSSAPSSTPSTSTSSTPVSISGNTQSSPNQSTNQSGSATSSASSGAAGNAPLQATHTQSIAEQKEARKLRIKVDQRDYDVSEDEAIKLAQLGYASQTRFQQAAQMKKQAEDFLSALKDPKRLHETLANPALGLSQAQIREFAEEYLANELRREQLSPEQRQIQELQARLAKEETEKKTFQQQQEAQQRQTLETHYANDYQQKIISALDTGGLPKTERTVQRMANYMAKALEMGVEVDPKDVTGLVRQDYITELNALTAQMPGDALISFFGDDIANKIRKADLARLKAALPQSATPPPPVVEESTDGGTMSTPVTGKMKAAVKADKPMNIHEWRSMIEKRVKS